MSSHIPSVIMVHYIKQHLIDQSKQSIDWSQIAHVSTKQFLRFTLFEPTKFICDSTTASYKKSDLLYKYI